MGYPNKPTDLCTDQKLLGQIFPSNRPWFLVLPTVNQLSLPGLKLSDRKFGQFFAG